MRVRGTVQCTYLVSKSWPYVVSVRLCLGETQAAGRASRAPSNFSTPADPTKRAPFDVVTSVEWTNTHRERELRGKNYGVKWEIESKQVQGHVHRGKTNSKTGTGSARARILLARVVLGQVDTTGSRAALRAASTGRTARARSSRSARLGHQRVERNLFRCTPVQKKSQSLLSKDLIGKRAIESEAYQSR